MTSEKHENTQQQDHIDTSDEDGQGKELRISELERKKRKENVEFANTSANLSGLEVTEGMKLLGERYINGEINLDEFVSISQQRHASALQK